MKQKPKFYKRRIKFIVNNSMESKRHLNNFFGIIKHKLETLLSAEGLLGCSSVDYRLERYVQNKVKGHTKDKSVWRRRDALIVSIR